jgi:hypothetical protein
MSQLPSFDILIQTVAQFTRGLKECLYFESAKNFPLTRQLQGQQCSRQIQREFSGKNSVRKKKLVVFLKKRLFFSKYNWILDILCIKNINF